MSIAYITHPQCLLHEMGAGHPESPQRLIAIQDQLVASGLDAVLLHHEAPRATREQLERAHDTAYVKMLFDVAPKEGLAYLDPDTAMNPHSLEAARRAAGAVVLGVDLVLGGTVPMAFCAVRPPGHHAEHDRAMGFCLFNNVAVGAAHALAAHGLERVAILDFDVHHCNGTEDIFTDEPRVLLCSSFQHPYYPYRGADTVSDHIVNVPLPAGTAGTDFRAAIEARWMPALHEFRPQLLLVSAGFDAHHEDPLANLMLTEGDYSWITRQIKAAADRHCVGRIVSVLEGGYSPPALGRSVVAHLKALQGAQTF